MSITPDMKFGKLHSKETHPNINHGSGKKILWLCDCGKKRSIEVYKVTSLHNTSCGKCNEISAEEVKNKKLGKLRIKFPISLNIASHKKILCVCDCGREKMIIIYYLFNGHTTSCGMCSMILAKDIADKLYGKLRIKIPKDTFPGAHKKVEWLCDCGRTTLAAPYSVTSGSILSCGKCSIITAEEMKDQWFHNLIIETPCDIKPKSNEKIWWRCKCGNRTFVAPCCVTSGNTKSCGRCRDSIEQWFNSNKTAIKNMKCPVYKLPDGGMQPLEPPILRTDQPFKTNCPACNAIYYPMLDNIKQGTSLTCGCASYRVSSGQKSVNSFIESLNLETKFEYDVNGLKYDIFVPSHNLLIEYQGLKWHAVDGAKQRDTKKFRNAIEHKFDFLSIFEDEWKYNQEKVKALLKNKLGIIKSIPLRPSQCDIVPIISQEADAFYIQFHYIGKCHPKLTYGVFYDSQLIACISFSHPTRQSKHPWELVRMTSNPEFKIHGIWSKLFKKFIAENSPSSVVSFSDNRLFQGSVYEKMGFKFDGNVTPDYYWVKGDKRHHKSALRKTNAEKLTGLTETVLREAQGYTKVWDLGKKRWLFTP